MPAGRPSKFDEVKAGKICRLLMIGLTLEEASRSVGIHRDTLHRWRTKGKLATRGKFAEFYDAVERALEECKVNSLIAIEKAMRGEKGTRKFYDSKGNVIREEDYYLFAPQWTAAAWRLERLDPKRWGRQVPMVQVDVSQDNRTQIVAQVQQMSGAELEEKLKFFEDENRKLLEEPGEGKPDA